jgi:YidC/Oxa1 family membrane protein insertase
MDRNTITGLVLIFAIFLGFSLYNNSKITKAFETSMERADSLYDAGNMEEARVEYLKALKYKPNTDAAGRRVDEINRILTPSATVTEDTLQEEVVPDRQDDIEGEAVQVPVTRHDYGRFSDASEGSQEFIVIENDLIELKISTLGGRPYSARLKEFTTHDSRPLILFDGDSTLFGFNFFTADNRPVRTNDLFFEPYNTESYIDASERDGVATLRLNAEGGGFIEYRYTLSPDLYLVKFDVSFSDLDNVIAGNQNALTLNWNSYIPQQEKGRTNELSGTQIKYKHYQDEVDGFRERSQKEYEEAEIPTRLRWVAFKDQFFSTVLIAEESFLNGFVTSSIMPEGSRYLKYFTAELSLPYDGNDDNVYNMQFFMGPNHFKTLKRYGYELHEIIYLGKNIIRWINQYVIIQLFNFLNKFIGNYGIIILILTLIIKTVLYPLTFKSYQSQAKMKVLKPMVDELAKKFPKKEDAVKKQQATMDLYKKAGVIPMYGDHVSLFTLLMTVSTILTTRLNSPTGQDQMPGMKMMMYMMPVMFMLILNNFSSGLTYYYFLANLITLGQNWISKRFIDEQAVLRKLEANRKKPVQKSKFQQRLEEAAKQKGYKPAKK